MPDSQPGNRKKAGRSILPPPGFCTSVLRIPGGIPAPRGSVFCALAIGHEGDHTLIVSNAVKGADGCDDLFTITWPNRG